MGVVGSSASPWGLDSSFSDNFDLKVTVTATRKTGGTRAVKVQSGDAGAYNRSYRFSALPKDTKSLTVTFSGRNEIPASFKVDAVGEASPCECEKLTARIGTPSREYGVFPPPKVDSFPSGLELEFFVRGDLKCSRGERGSCRGLLELSLTRADRADGLSLREDSTTVECVKPCGTSSATSQRVVVLGGPRFGSKALGKTVRTISLEIDRVCAERRSTTVVEFAFDPGGTLDLERSDLDGNGIPDGREKK